MTEERREQLDESLNELDTLMQRWNQRLTLDNLALAESYLPAEAGDKALEGRLSLEASPRLY